MPDSSQHPQVSDAELGMQLNRPGEEFDLELRRLRAEGKKIALCHGVFDILHPGHLEHLEQAANFADILVVSITDDQYVNKGPGRPVVTAPLRKKMLEALKVVDLVTISTSQTALDSIARVRPDFFVKGSDYLDLSADITGNISTEVAAVARFGGRIEFTTGLTMSSSTLINQRGQSHSVELRSWLAEFKTEFTSSDIADYLNKLSNLKVLVVGESIVDNYVFCEALGKTSKDPVLAFLPKNRESQLGGAIAIARHSAGLGADTRLLTRIGKDSEGARVRAGMQVDEAVDCIFVESLTQSTIIKTRYLDESTGAKLFETYDMTDEETALEESQSFAARLALAARDVDLILVADYGHGLLSPEVIEVLSSLAGVVAVNTQSNAGNRGLNSISRYERIDLLSLNGGEVSRELRARHSTVVSLLPELAERSGATTIFVTEGAKGLAMWRDNLVTEMPAFTESVVDRVGAGDALFAAVSLMVAAGAPLAITGLIGNLAGAAMVSDLGNRHILDSKNLIRHADSLLK